MRVLVAGATGVIGRPLVRSLSARGHEVVGTTRTPARAGVVRADGGRPLVLDVLDRGATVAALDEVRPDVLVHEATALTGFADPRTLERDFRATDLLRTVGTDNLLAGAGAAGTPRVVAQSYAGWPYARTGGALKDEDAPLDADPPRPLRGALAAIVHAEQAVLGLGSRDGGPQGLVLRYGTFYGPGTLYAADGAVVRLVRLRRFPLVGDGAGIWSFVHVDDAAEATALAVESDVSGVLNVVDDDPAPVHEWLPALADVLGAPKPLRVPLRLAEILVGPHVRALMHDSRGALNGRARALLGWAPSRGSWREGLAAELAA